MNVEQAEERFDSLVEKMAKPEGVTEQLKAQARMLWVRMIIILGQERRRL